jgi:hypothetical protein
MKPKPATALRRATDATGKSSQQEVSLTIKDVDEDPPVFTSGATATAIDENSGAAQMVYKANATDASARAHSLAGADATKFRIDAKTGAHLIILTTKPSPATHSPSCNRRLGNQSEQKVTLNINDVDDTPPVADLVFAPDRCNWKCRVVPIAMTSASPPWATMATTP